MAGRRAGASRNEIARAHRVVSNLDQLPAFSRRVANLGDGVGNPLRIRTGTALIILLISTSEELLRRDPSGLKLSRPDTGRAEGETRA